MQTLYWLFHHHFQKSNISFQRKPCSPHYWTPIFIIRFFNLQNQVVKYHEFEVHEKSSHWNILVFVPKLWCFPLIFFDHDYWMVKLYGPKVKETPFSSSFLLLVLSFQIIMWRNPHLLRLALRLDSSIVSNTFEWNCHFFFIAESLYLRNNGINPSWEPILFCSFLPMFFSKAFLINLLTFDKHHCSFLIFITMCNKELSR